MNDPIIKDIDIPFPHFMVLKASAGSGKTYTLTKRYVQFLLSRKINFNKLPSILAITFSNNASKEMKTRIIRWLKDISLDNKEKAAELARIISIPEIELNKNAFLLINEIFNNYSDFKVLTIDSFMTAIFKASAIDFDYTSDFEILMNNSAVIEYAFNIFLRRVKEGSKEALLMEDVIKLIAESKKIDSSFQWQPTNTILDEIKQLYKKLATNVLQFEDHSPDIFNIQREMSKLINDIELKIERSNLIKNKKSKYEKILRKVRDCSFADLAGDTASSQPVNKPKTKQDDTIYNEIIKDWERFNQLIVDYTLLFSQTWYLPYLKVLKEFNRDIDKVKRQLGLVFIEDINSLLAGYINSEKVPDVYFRIGETIYHYLIDEFQDTSPIQWQNLFPLIDNSLSCGGSLFCVGDTKQAIYGFRNADYKIMKDAETTNPFPSTGAQGHIVKELDINFRSLDRILSFNQTFFKECLNNDKYREAAIRSGLIDWLQTPEAGNEGKGHVEIILLESQGDTQKSQGDTQKSQGDTYEKDEEASSKEEQTIIELLKSLKDRGYNYGDIAILASRNNDVVDITAWLNKAGILFISYSNLDIRRRKITGEIISLLNFLDSPLDDLSFVTVCLGSILTETLRNEGIHYDLHGFLFKNRKDTPIYKAFQREYPDIWNKYFSLLFTRSGYLPIYDLVTEVYRVFKLFERFETEEAALVKILEVIKSIEESGTNSLREFIVLASDLNNSDSEWNIALPEDNDAVKVMTIHKSKGLGFEVCIVLLHEEKRTIPITNIINNPERLRTPILRVTQKIADCVPELQKLYEEARLKELVNSLNKLYVGFTRPKKELYIVAIRGSADDKKYFPIDLLEMPLLDGFHGTKPIEKVISRAAPAVEKEKPQKPVPILYQSIPLKMGTHNKITTKEALRGEFIHKILACIDYIDKDFFQINGIMQYSLINIIRDVNNKTAGAGGISYDVSNIFNVLKDFLNDFNTMQYFIKRENRIVMNEKEFLDSNGVINRMDRVIIDNASASGCDGIITVIDYKTGGSNDNYQSQINRYINILKEFYCDRKIEGVILFLPPK